MAISVSVQGFYVHKAVGHVVVHRAVFVKRTEKDAYSP